MEIQNFQNHLTPIANKAAILKTFKQHILPNGMSDCAETWWESLDRPGDSEVLKVFCSDIQDDCFCCHLGNLQTKSTP